MYTITIAIKAIKTEMTSVWIKQFLPIKHYLDFRAVLHKQLLTCYKLKLKLQGKDPLPSVIGGNRRAKRRQATSMVVMFLKNSIGQQLNPWDFIEVVANCCLHKLRLQL